ncbi:MAG: hypothetical protein HZB38_07890 [Planctomycetes bacterium]|nr:hypothetical protein [Planctomycetota bacterium]
MIAAAAACTSLSAALACQQPRVASQPAVGQPAKGTASQPDAAAPALDEVVDRILTRRETRDVTDLKAKVVWETGTIQEADDPLRKFGQILYRAQDPIPQFKVHFTSKIVDRNKKATIDEQHFFDGEMYVELNAETKTVTYREIRGPNDKRNPYKVGEGAFPLPFGQKKQDILREYEVTRVAESLKDPPKTDHLKLTPRKGSQSEARQKSVEFWVVREDGEPAGLPVRVRVVERPVAAGEENFIVVTFSDVELNTGLGVSPFSINAPDEYQTFFEPLGGELKEGKPPAGKTRKPNPVP